jgi:hypothetical protein
MNRNNIGACFEIIVDGELCSMRDVKAGQLRHRNRRGNNRSVGFSSGKKMMNRQTAMAEGRAPYLPAAGACFPGRFLFGIS